MTNGKQIGLLFFVAAACWTVAHSSVAQTKPESYLGQWALHRADGAGWLELRLEKDKLAGRLLWGGGSVMPLDEVIDEGERVVLVLNRRVQRKTGQTAVVSSRWEVRAKNGQLAGKTLPANPQASGEAFVGKRLPPSPPAPDLSRLRYGEPVELFNGRDLTGWTLTNPAQKSGFQAADGMLVNEPVQPEGQPRVSYGNLMTTSKFDDFNLKLEVNVPAGSNSGVYLRGIYEVQISDSFGKPLDSHNMGALYSRLTPTVAAEKPAGQWQALDITLCDRHLTVTLNGQTIIDNQPVQGVTGGALTADEFSPGPIYLQGDHGKVMFRNLVLRPIIKG